jgi:hypothetical protein
VRIAILHAAHEMRDWRLHYFLGFIAAKWEQQGHEVVDCFGPRPGIVGDLLFVHVNRSVVSKPYLEMARRHPRSINGWLNDIRKRRISRLLIERPDDPWTGPVIVKTDLNHGGKPEYMQHHRSWDAAPLPLWSRMLLRRLTRPRRADFPQGVMHYPIFPTLREVPRRYLRDRRYVVERFIPEREDSRYVLRHGYRLGNRFIAYRYSGDQPVLRAPEEYDATIAFPDELRHQLIENQIDYAMVDYVEHEGRIHILDMNKTIGDPSGEKIAAFLAAGIR